ncbi:GFA family protein [Paludibacterium sp.]|uniref:GFA family protein n=1 Tax=Paludibacterium sp. TaxID=1917523 RepID=UPI0025D5AEC0|nr:GFA family protein [Paludibacterium sp.]MBV8648679.1 GFA family protein [Paludibacterium sp.]
MRSKYAGQCLCGGIHYSVDVDPVFAGNCHCKDCQRTSGSAFVPAMVFPEKDVVISGEAKYFASTADSGNTHSRGFCPHCGSQLFAKFSHLPGLLGIKAGTLNDSARYVPMLDFHVASAATWDVMNPELPKKQGGA